MDNKDINDEFNNLLELTYSDGHIVRSSWEYFISQAIRVRYNQPTWPRWPLPEETK